MELEAKEGGRLLFVSADGDQISNDHYPHYRLLYRLGGREPQLLSHNVTFFDVAGMEGLTWVWAFVTLSVLSAWGSLALAFIWMSVCDRRRRQAEVSASSG
jgi:hypothetical protein